VGGPAPADRGAGFVMTVPNRRTVLARRPPAAMIQDDDFALETTVIPEPGEDELVVCVELLGFDSARRGWFNEGRS
jgi:NADPH-dependent curcumin reductase CurA